MTVVVSFNLSNRQWRSKAMTSPTSYRSPESARMTKDSMSAGWPEPTMERLWNTKPKPGLRSTPQPGLDGHCPPPRRAPHCTWKIISQESPPHHWAKTTWVQTRGWPPHPPPTHPPIQLNASPAQVGSWSIVEPNAIHTSVTSHIECSRCCHYCMTN